MEITRTTLFKLRSEIRARLNASRSLIYRLPNELLVRIIRFSLHPTDFPETTSSFPYYFRLVELRLVSSRWHNAIDSEPTFWVQIDAQQGRHVVQRLLDASKEALINVSFDVYDDSEYPLSGSENGHELVTEASRRWQAILIQSSTTSFQQHRILRAQTPALSSLSFKFFGEPEQVQTHPCPLDGQSRAHLSSIYLYNIILSFPHLDLSYLTTLSLHAMPGNGAPNIRELLQATPALRTLDIQFCPHDFSSPPEPLDIPTVAFPNRICLPHLADFTISHYAPFVASIMNAIDAPNLCRFSCYSLPFELSQLGEILRWVGPAHRQWQGDTVEIHLSHDRTFFDGPATYKIDAELVRASDPHHPFSMSRDSLCTILDNIHHQECVTRLVISSDVNPIPADIIGRLAILCPNVRTIDTAQLGYHSQMPFENLAHFPALTCIRLPNRYSWFAPIPEGWALREIPYCVLVRGTDEPDPSLPAM